VRLNQPGLQPLREWWLDHSDLVEGFAIEPPQNVGAKDLLQRSQSEKDLGEDGVADAECLGHANPAMVATMRLPPTVSAYPKHCNVLLTPGRAEVLS
jgi:hypothetical protein